MELITPRASDISVTNKYFSGTKGIVLRNTVAWRGDTRNSKNRYKILKLVRIVHSFQEYSLEEIKRVIELYKKQTKKYPNAASSQEFIYINHILNRYYNTSLSVFVKKNFRRYDKPNIQSC